MSAVVAAVRTLFGNARAVPHDAPWPLQHPVVAALGFLRQVRAQANGGGLVIGVDLVKDSAVLEAAYDDALGAFDGATIATTHQFCHLVLRSLGVAGDTDSNATLVEDLEDLLGEVVDDLYLARFGNLEGAPPFSHAQALKLGREAASDPQAGDRGNHEPFAAQPLFPRAQRHPRDRR